MVWGGRGDNRERDVNIMMHSIQSTFEKLLQFSHFKLDFSEICPDSIPHKVDSPCLTKLTKLIVLNL